MSAIAPIKGMLRKRIVADLTIALGGGTFLAYSFWYGIHIPRVQQRDAFYAKLNAGKEE